VKTSFIQEHVHKFGENHSKPKT